VRWLPVAIATAIAAVLVVQLSDSLSEAVLTSAAMGLIILSVIVVTGYAGQLSLAQFALAGIGGWFAAHLVGTYGWGFEIAFVVAVIGTIPVGLIVGAPALRHRGV